MRKFFILFLLITPVAIYSQEISFNTVFPTGDIYTSSGSLMPENSLLSYGTFDTVDPSSVLTSSDPLLFSEFDTLIGDYTQLGSATFNSSGEVNTGVVSLTAGLQVYFWAFDVTFLPTSSSEINEVALFGSITVPASGTFNYTVNSAVSNGDVLIGSTLDGDIYLAAAVPEPSTYAAIVGLLSLGFVMWRRRK